MVKGANLSEDITKIWHPPNCDVITLLNHLSKMVFSLIDLTPKGRRKPKRLFADLGRVFECNKFMG